MLDFKGLVFHFSYFSIYQLLPACSLWNITNMHLKSSDFDQLSEQDRGNIPASKIFCSIRNVSKSYVCMIGSIVTVNFWGWYMFHPCLHSIQVWDCIALSSWGWAQSGATVALSLCFKDTVQKCMQLTIA